MEGEPPKREWQNEENLFLKKHNDRRIELLQSIIKDIPSKSLEDYLSNFSPELISAKEKIQYAVNLIELFSPGSLSLTTRQMLLLDEIIVGSEERDLYISSFKDKIAGIRAMAIFCEKVLGVDSKAEIKEIILLTLAGEVKKFGIEQPASLRFLLNQLDPISEYLDKLRQEYIKQGMHPKMADKIIDAEKENTFKDLSSDLEEDEKLLVRLLEDYPDPGVIVNLILGLKDGKLPL